MPADPAHGTLTGRRVVELLGMAPLETEGGWFAQTYRDERSSAILYVLIAPDFSALHRVDGPELYHWHAGDALDMLLLHPGGRVERIVLGPDLVAGERPQLAVPGGVWQGSTPRRGAGAWSLVGTTMAPGFQPEAFALGRRAELLEGWPDAAAEIVRLTRS
jgi:uncharacterized protein